MQTNPVEAIEKAELMAEQIIQDANSNRAQIIKSAHEKAAQVVADAQKEADISAKSVVANAKDNSILHKANALESLKKEIDDMVEQGQQNKEKAVEEIIQLLTALV